MLFRSASIAIAVTGAQEYHLRKVVGEIERFVDTWPAVEVLQVDVTVHAPDD